jgi:hypothetical protein
MQDDFQAFMLRHDAAIESHVVGTQRVPIATRLAIYGDGYCSRLIEVLEANYPALAKLLGPEDFSTLGTAYVRAHDSHFRSVRYYGAELANFLSAEPAYSGAPLLAELARWEWAMTEAFDAADAAPIDVSALARIEPQQWADLRFEFHPSLRRLALLWNAPQIWKALTDESERPAASVQAEPVQWLLWRENLQTFFRSVPVPEAEALDAALAGRSFGELCATLARHYSEAETPVRAAGFLKYWIESSLIISS